MWFAYFLPALSLASSLDTGERGTHTHMRASKTRVASKGIRVATDDGRSASSSADTQQQSATGMSSGLQGALATVVLLGTVVLLMGSSLRQVSQAAILDAASQATSVAASLPTDATSRKPGQVELLQRFRSLQAERGQARRPPALDSSPHTPSFPHRHNEVQLVPRCTL